MSPDPRFPRKDRGRDRAAGHQRRGRGGRGHRPDSKTEYGSWWTYPGGVPEKERATTELRIPSGTGISPTLLFQKRHTYDLKIEKVYGAITNIAPELETTRVRPDFLQQVARIVEGTRRSQVTSYASWLQRYRAALQGLGVEPKTCLEATTVWRLVVGFATNPALETGLTLHHLYGFPYIPGSGVKGLVHHVAEMELLEGREEWLEESGNAPSPDEPEGLKFLAQAELVKVLFGRLSVERPLDKDKKPYGPRVPQEILRHWLNPRVAQELDDETQRRISGLLDRHTGGLLTFFDAVPGEGERDLLQLDILNPHYPNYYDRQGNAPPSDDQNPRPVYFLAVRPGAKFLFPFRLGELPAEEAEKAQDEEERLRARVLRQAVKQAVFSSETELDAETPWPELREAVRSVLVAKVQGWLAAGLTHLGAGGKTAAGYGYFETVEGTGIGRGPVRRNGDEDAAGAETGSAAPTRPP